MAAYADNDAFVWGRISSGRRRGGLYRVTNGVATSDHDVAAPRLLEPDQCGIHVFSPSDIVATADIQVFRIDSVAKTAAAIGSAFN